MNLPRCCRLCTPCAGSAGFFRAVLGSCRCCRRAGQLPVPEAGPVPVVSGGMAVWRRGSNPCLCSPRSCFTAGERLIQHQHKQIKRKPTSSLSLAPFQLTL